MLTGLGNIIPWLVIAAEGLVSFLLLLPGTFRLVGFYGAFCLMTMFTVYVFSILNFSNYVPCSCGGVLEKLGWEEHLVFNFAFVILAAAGIWLQTLVEDEKKGTEILA
jgi:uncharacterized membrane protein YphA (DoxX/SURF4 family)